MNHPNTSRNAEPSRAAEVFTAALEQPSHERTAWLERACSDDPALLVEVKRLLKAHDAAGDFMPSDVPRSADLEVQLARLKPEEAGETICGYKLLQEIGEGGFGVVWMAEQETPVRRRVALKIIKLGMDTREVVARFEQERQALAMMDHPNIAKVFDAGCTATGRSFFVMELVRGIRITDYCDENQLSTRERLQLCIQVCQAVQHAHQKGIIHRDLKPSNILVTVHDGTPVPKVIDFGVAKATQQRLTDLSFFTEFRQMIGTPAYMSPEQAEMSASLDIDTRSDIYSLGVLLYELLTGRTPFSAEELMRAGLDEIRRVIREDEPKRPSAALSALSENALTTAAQRRSSQPPHLIHLVRGDLDWVVMKALEKDRKRRYATAEALAADLHRHLQDEPVVARPPTAFYRFRKMVRRHRTAMSAAAAVLLALLVALATITAAYLRVRFVVADANEAYAARGLAASEQDRLGRIAERAVAEQGARTREFEAAQRFFHESIRAAAQDSSGTERLRAAVDQAVMQLGGDLSEQQLLEASLRQTIGTVYYQLGDLPKAAAMLLRAKELRCGYLPGSNPGELPIVARSLYSLAVVRMAAGQLDDARLLLGQALDLRDPRFGEGGMSPLDPLAVDILQALALVAADQGALVEADARAREALALARHLEPAGGWMTVRSLRLVSELFQRIGDTNAAAPLREEAMEMARRLPPDATRTVLPHPARLLAPE